MTPKQKDCLDAIARLTVNEVSPTFGMLADALGLSSKNGVHRLLEALEEQGYIRRQRHRARSIEVLRHPNLKAHLVALIEQHGTAAVEDALYEAREALIHG